MTFSSPGIGPRYFAMTTQRFDIFSIAASVAR